MNREQPNFEKVKTVLFNLVFHSKKTDISILMEQVQSKKLLPNIHIRKDTFKNDLENWLDNIDIRCVGKLIDVVDEVANKRPNLSFELPKWIKDKNFLIDYNSNGFLDLQKKCYF